MSDHKTKKRKTDATSADPPITDPRFANIQSDPRYRLPGKKNKVKLDKRFSQALKEDDFNRRAKVDRYGRPLETDSERKRLKRKYEFEEDSDNDEPDDDDEVQRELKRVGGTNARDLIREGRVSDEESSSDSSSDEDEEAEDLEEAELAPQTQNDVPEGDVSSRLAVVNLDWDNIRAEDLMAVFSSFLDPNGKLVKVSVYPSEFGKERMQREETEGPPKEVFAAAAAAEREDNEFENFGSESEQEEDDEALKERLIHPDDGNADFDSAALRRYQLDRLRYYYAILTFSSPATAKLIYDAVDGTEYLSTANFFDLRFVPDDTDFSSDTPREECTAISSSYKPNEFVTDALQHSKVKLTWDAEDTSRKEAAAQAFRSKDIRDLDDVDLAAYIGSDSSDSEDEPLDQAHDQPAKTNGTSKKDTERQKFRSLLGLAAEPASSKSKKDRAPVGNVEITFSAGLTSNDDPSKKRSVFENSPEPNETTIEKYVRKEKERKARRREKARATREGRTLPEDDAASDDDDDHDDATNKSSQKAKPQKDEDEDLGFDDPFFTGTATSINPSDPTTARAAASEKNKLRKEERLQKRREREADEAASAKQRRELELLMADDRTAADAGADSGKGKDKGPGVRHFDMREVERAERRARKEEKRKNKKGKSASDAAAAAGGEDGPATAPKQQQQQQKKTQDNVGDADAFKMDATDPRFAGRLYGNHEFAIDPSNPRFKGTRGMQALLEEGRMRKKEGDGRNKGGKTGGEGKEKAAKKKEKADGSKSAREGTAAGVPGEDVSSLVEKIKRRNV